MRKETNKYFELCQAVQGTNSGCVLLGGKKNVEETSDRIKRVGVKGITEALW